MYEEKTPETLLDQLQKSLERARADAEQASCDIERLELDLQDQKRRTGWLFGLAAGLIVALIALSWYSYPLIKQRSTFLTQLPPLEESLRAVGERLGVTEEQLSTWANQWDELGERMGNLEKTMSGNLSVARKAAQEQGALVHDHIMTELENRTEWLQVRLHRLEAYEQSQRASLAQFRNEIAAVQREMTQQIAQAQQESQSDVAALNEQLGSNRRELETFAQRFERRRVHFELAKDQNREIVPEVALTLTGIDANRQRINGWMRVVPEGRTLWVQSQGIQQPVIFYTQQDSRPYELMFTRVTKEGVVGYLLVPNRARFRAGETVESDTMQAALAQ